jgi:hypothetical protein
LNDESFVAYLNSEDVHDGTVCGVNEYGDHLDVLVKRVDGRLVRFVFTNVQSVRMNRAEGMVLYSLTEVQETPPYRRFCFTNWNEEDDAHLEVVAQEINTPET